MEEEEKETHSQYAQHSSVAVAAQAFEEHKPKTLNEDPFNVRAEELAVEECQRGFIVEKRLNETDMLVESCGCVIPGTPDGGFQDSTGALNLVQVVRVPLLPEMDVDTVGDVLYSTVLAKIVKSQQWMKATSVLPRDFIIFCWLPPVGAYQTCLEQSDALLWVESLLWNVRSGGWPFTLRIMVPLDPGGIFPNNFGLCSWKHSQTKLQYYLNDISYTMSAEDFLDDGFEDEEPMEWFLFGEDFDEVVEDAECELESSSPFGCLKEFALLIEQALENFEHVEESTRMAPNASLVHRFEAFADAVFTGSSSNDHPSLKASISTRIRERDAPPAFLALSPCLPWWDVKGLQRGSCGLRGYFAEGFCMDPPKSIESFISTKTNAVGLLFLF